jgi:hypothetical protein
VDDERSAPIATPARYRTPALLSRPLPRRYLRHVVAVLTAGVEAVSMFGAVGVAGAGVSLPRCLVRLPPSPREKYVQGVPSTF